MNCEDLSLPYIIQTVPKVKLEVVMLTVPASLSQAFEDQLNQPQRFENNDDQHPKGAQCDDYKS